MSETHGRGHAAVRRRAWSITRRRRAAPYADDRVQIRDDDGNVLARGEVGEICSARRGGASSGTGTTPRPRPSVLDDERWYRSGDFGRIDDGVLFAREPDAAT